MLHPDEGTIHAWLDDQLAPEERAKLEQHFDQCEQCAVLVVEARGLVAGAGRIVGALDGVRSGVVPPTKRLGAPSKSLWRALRLTPIRAAIAATLLLATATVFTVRQDDRTRNTVSRTVATPASAAPPATVTATVPAPLPAPLAAPLAGPPAGIAPSPTAAVSQRAVPELAAKRNDQALALDSAPPASEKTRANTVAQVPAAPRDSSPATATVASGMAASRSALADTVAVAGRRDMAANARQPVHADSIAMRAAKAAPVPQPAAQRRFAGAISQIVATGMVQTTDARAFGCYRLNVDSLRDRFTTFRQFGLSAPNGVNVVHALGSSGRPDSVIAGAVWRPLDRDSVAVSTPRSSPPAILVFALGEEGRNAPGRLTANGETTPVQVLRTRCP